MKTFRKGSVSVLFNEPKLLKFNESDPASARVAGFSALQRAEIAEMTVALDVQTPAYAFQCSSTSRNC